MREEKLKLTIFHTNDMHGRYEAIACLGSILRRERAAAEAEGRSVYYMDAGDAADRRVNFTSLTKGAAFMPLLNALGCSVQTMGNAISLPYGIEAMSAAAARANFPILAANCRDGRRPLPRGLQESVLLPLPGGLKLGVFGLTAPWDGMYVLFGLHFPDEAVVARRQVARLKAQGGAPIVLLSHLGLRDDRELLDEVDGISLVIGGHSHSELPTGEWHGETLIAQTGDYARYLGRIDLEIDPRDGQVLSAQARLIEVPADTPPDPAVLKAIGAAEREAEDLAKQPRGVCQTRLDLDYEGECAIGDLAADALREHMGADAALITSGHFHQGLPAGEITLGDLNRATRSSANPALSAVRGEQIRQALEAALEPDYYQREEHGFRGSPLGFAQISGMRVWYNPQAPKGERVVKIEIQDKPIQAEHVYKLAHTDAESSQRIGCLKLESGQQLRDDVPTIVREMLEAYFARHSPVKFPAGGRWVPV